MKLSESALQQHIGQTLAGLGYHTLETGNGRKKVQIEGECPCCRRTITLTGYPTGWQGNTPGLPDTLHFRHAAHFPRVAILNENKTATGAIRPAQKTLIDAGRVNLSRSVGDAVRGVLETELAMDAYRLECGQRDRITRFLKENEGRI